MSTSGDQPVDASRIDYERLATAIVDELERRGLFYTSSSDGLVRLQDLADELGVSRQTIYRRLNRHDIPKRDVHGQIKHGGGYTYISRSEWAEKCSIDTRAVRS
jgi:transcriptional antiterminator